MSEPFLGEIRIVGFNFPPRGWADCDGQLIAINSNTALFSLFGTAFGGDARSTFGLPDLRSRVPVHEGQGAGLSFRSWGEKGGSETVSVTAQHSHSLAGGSLPSTASPGNQATPDGHIVATPNDGENNFSDGGTTGGMSLSGVTGSTGSAEVTNMPPFLTVRFVVAMEGLFPSRS